MKTTKVLMVCLGNICRSPLAEGLLRSKVDEQSVSVDSAGTSNYHQGEYPDPRMIDTATAHHIGISHLQSRQFTVADFDAFDFIYAMDQSNYDNIIKLARNTTDKAKVELILNVLPDTPYQSVPDPYFGGGKGFKLVYQLLNEATDLIAKKLQQVS